MKKLTGWICVVISCILFLNSCALIHAFQSEKTILKTKIQQVVTGINKRDKSYIRKLFVPNVSEQITDENLDLLFESIDSEIVHVKSTGDAGVEEINDNGTYRKVINNLYVIEASTQYELYIEVVLTDSLNPDNVGLNLVLISKLEDSDACANWWRTSDVSGGIYFFPYN